MEYDEVLNTLEEAENRVAELRRLIIQQKVANGQATSSDYGEDSKAASGAGKRSISRDEPDYTKYLDLSAVKLFEECGEEVFRIPDSVGLFFIVPGAPVRTAARSAVLRIVRIAEEFQDQSHPPAFVQVGDWVYPLMPNSMIYRSEHKYYLFPDLLSTTPGSSVGVVLPKTATPEERQRFEMLLLGYLNMPEFPSHPPESFGKSTELILAARTSVSLIRTESGVYSQRNSATSINQQTTNRDEGTRKVAESIHINTSGEGSYGKRIGVGMKAGGQLISRGFELGAKGTATAIGMGATCLMRSLNRAQTDTDIPEPVVDAIIYAREVTGRVVELSSYVLSTLSSITSNIAGLTACWMKNASAPLFEKCVDCSGISQETIDEVTSEVKDIGEGIANGVAEAYAGLENASKILAKALSNNTVEVVTHCYGPSAATILVGATEVLGNVTYAGINKNRAIDKKRQAIRMAQKAGIALAVEDCK